MKPGGRRQLVRMGGIEVGLDVPQPVVDSLTHSGFYRRVVRPARQRMGRSQPPANTAGPAALTRPAAPATADGTNGTGGANIRERIAGISWYHSIDLGHGIVTPGFVDHRNQLQHYGLPESLKGLRCLDVATWDGFWAFEMERRGAGEVVALDLARLADSDVPSLFAPFVLKTGGGQPLGGGFSAAHEILGSKVRREVGNVYDLTPERFGMFDFIFLSDLLLHIRDPQLALQRIFSVCRGAVVIADVFNPLLERRADGQCLTQFMGWVNDQVWWLPSTDTLARMMLVAGFESVEERSRFILNARRADAIHKVTLAGAVPGVSQGMAVNPDPTTIDEAGPGAGFRPQLKREIQVGLKSSTIIFRLPEETADRITRSAVYRRLVRPSARWLLGRLHRQAAGSRPGGQALPPRLPAVPPAPAVITPDLRATIERVIGIDWQQVIDLGQGIATPGRVDERRQPVFGGLPASLDGLRCLELGGGDGFWAFEMERRGAKEVVALDWSKTCGNRGFRARGDGFETARAVLGSRVRRVSWTVYDLTPALAGTFDFILALDLLGNVRDPQLALEALRAVCRGSLLLSDVISPSLDRFGALSLSRFIGGEAGQPWWAPGARTLQLMLTLSGFEPVDELARYVVDQGSAGVPDRVVLRAGVPARHSWLAIEDVVEAES